MARDDDEDTRRVETVVEELGKYFDEVQVFAIRYSPKNEHTTITHKGKGNFYSIMGVIRDWIISHEERRRMMTRKQIQQEEEEE